MYLQESNFLCIYVCCFLRVFSVCASAWGILFLSVCAFMRVFVWEICIAIVCRLLYVYECFCVCVCNGYLSGRMLEYPGL